MEQMKMIIVSVGNTTQIYLDGKVYGDNITEFNFYVDALGKRKLKAKSDGLIKGTTDVESFKKAIDVILTEKDDSHEVVGTSEIIDTDTQVDKTIRHICWEIQTGNVAPCEVAPTIEALASLVRARNRL